MTPLQRQMVFSWFVVAAIVILALAFVANDSHAYLWVGFFGIPVHQYLRKEVDTDDFRPFQQMAPLEQIAALLWYLLAAGVIISVVVKTPNAIDYEFRQFLILLGIVFVPLIPILLRREARLFREAGRHET